MRLFLQHTATCATKEEHDFLIAIINGMRHFVRQIERTGKAPGLKVLRAVLPNISEYPEERHHPKEGHYLLSRPDQRSSTAGAAIAEPGLLHAQGEVLVHGLEHAPIRREPLGEGYGKEYEKLFSLIKTITPTPIGVGPALE